MNNTLTTIAFGLTTVFAATSVHAVDYQSSQYEKLYTDYLAVSSGDGGSVKNLVTELEAMVLEDDTDPFALVMLGSAQAMLGRDALMPWSKMKHTETGLDNMARAVSMLQPEHYQQRFQSMAIAFRVKTTAGITFSKVPNFFGRSEDAYDLFEDVLSDSRFLSLPEQAQSFAFYHGVHAARNIGLDEQAESWAQTLSAMPVDDIYVQAAKNRGLN